MIISELLVRIDLNNFFEGLFPLKSWNHFDNEHERTQNKVE